MHIISADQRPRFYEEFERGFAVPGMLLVFRSRLKELLRNLSDMIE